MFILKISSLEVSKFSCTCLESFLTNYQLLNTKGNTGKVALNSYVPSGIKKTLMVHGKGLKEQKREVKYLNNDL